jgi:hypothetical protein
VDVAYGSVPLVDPLGRLVARFLSMHWRPIAEKGPQDSSWLRVMMEKHRSFCLIRIGMHGTEIDLISEPVRHVCLDEGMHVTANLGMPFRSLVESRRWAVDIFRFFLSFSRFYFICWS